MTDKKFIPTDEVFTLDPERKAIALSHQGHTPTDHICEDCEDPWEDWCWAKQNGLSEPVLSGPNPAPVGYRSETDCKCECHHIFWECELSASYLENEGKPLYRMVDVEEEQKEDGKKIISSPSVVDKLDKLPESVLEEFVEAVKNFQPPEEE